MLFRHELEKKWGEHCHSCAYCLSISKTVVTAQYDGTEEEFCSEDCNSKYKMLFCHVSRGGSSAIAQITCPLWIMCVLFCAFHVFISEKCSVQIKSFEFKITVYHFKK